MSFIINAKGNSPRQFTFGKAAGVTGPTLYTGPETPAGTLGIEGDLYVQGGTNLSGTSVGAFYQKINGVWNAITTEFLPLTGGTLSGPLYLWNDPVGPMESCTKQYTDSLRYALQLKTACRLLATANINLSNPGSITIDGRTPNVNDRIFCVNQTIQLQNGLYQWNGTSSPMTRTDDANTDQNVTTGMYSSITDGQNYVGQAWALITEEPLSLDVTPLQFTRIYSPGQLNPQNGFTTNGNTFSINSANTSHIVVNSNSIDTGADIATLSDRQTFTGTKTFTSSIISTVSTGTSPLSVSSTTQVDNLNAALLNGYDATAFIASNGTVPKIIADLHIHIPDPTTTPSGTIFIAKNNGNIFQTDGSAWNQIGGGLPKIIEDVYANLPSATTTPAGTLFIGTDTLDWYYNNGTTWSLLSGGVSGGLYAPIDSPSFTGSPTAPTPTITDNSSLLATTAFVQGLLANPPAAVTLPANSTAVTQSATDKSTNVATTEFVAQYVSTKYSFSFNNTTDWGTSDGTDYTISVAHATHNRGTDPSIQVFSFNGTSYSLASPDSLQVFTNGDVSFSVSASPDGRFTGRILIL